MVPHGSSLSESYNEDPIYDDTISSDYVNAQIVLPEAGINKYFSQMIGE